MPYRLVSRREESLMANYILRRVSREQNDVYEIKHDVITLMESFDTKFRFMLKYKEGVNEVFMLDYRYITEDLSDFYYKVRYGMTIKGMVRR